MSILNTALDTFLNKGGAGVSLSREDTVERINPLLRQHILLNHAYRQVIAALAGSQLADTLLETQRTARMDVGKLSETVLSAGGRPYLGTDVEPGSAALPEGDGMLRALLDQEQALLDATETEIALDHQIRTQAILGNVQTHSRERLKIVERATKTALR